MKQKRCLSLFLSVAMAVSMLPDCLIAHGASESEPEVISSFDSGAVNFAAVDENSVGSLLAREMADAQEQQQDESDGMPCYISYLEFENNVAEVKYYAPMDCTLIVAIYTDDELEMYAYGKRQIQADTAEAFVTVPYAPMPETYLAKAFLVADEVDEETATDADFDALSPLSAEFCNVKHTKEMLEFYAKSVDDFKDVAENHILIMEEDKTVADDPYSFGVLTDNTVVLQSTATQNLVTYDETNGKYTVSAPDSATNALAVGQIAFFQQVDGSNTVFKIAAVSKENGKLVLTEDQNFELEDVFAFLRMKASATTKDALITDDDTADAAQRALPKREGGKSKDSDDDYYLKPLEAGGVTCNIGLQIEPNLEIGYSNGFHFAASLDYYAGIELVSDGEASLFERQLSVGKWVFYIHGITLTVEPQLVLQVEYKAKTTLGARGSIGTQYDKGIGWQDTSAAPTLDGETLLEGKCFLGFSLQPTVYFVEKHFLSIGFDAMVGITVDCISQMNSDCHSCMNCFDGTISIGITLEVKFNACFLLHLDHEASLLNVELGKFYISDPHGFGWGECPYKDGAVPIEEPEDDGPIGADGLTDTQREYLVFVPCNRFGIKNSKSNWSTVIGTADSYAVVLNDNAKKDELTSIVIPSYFNQKPVTRIGFDYMDENDTGFFWTPSQEIDGQYFNAQKCNPYGFQNCTNLVSVRIPSTVTHIGNKAFKRCSKLKNFKIPSGCVDIGDESFSGTAVELLNIQSPELTLGKSCFANCQQLKEVKIANITLSYNTVFENCTNLKTVEILAAENTTSITERLKSPTLGVCMFDNCTSLNNVSLPDNIDFLYSTFSNCTALEHITLPDNLKYMQYTFDGCTNLKDVLIPLTVTDISDAFSNCTSLESIIVPSSVTEMSNAFYGCTNLKFVTLSYGLTTLDGFSYCTSLKSIEIPDTVTKLQSKCFFHCEALQSIELPDNTIELEDSCFDSCYALQSVTLPANLRNIPPYCFNDCRSLASVTFPESCNTLNHHAFTGCTSLTSFTFPNAGGWCGGVDLENCTNLRTIIFPAYIQQIEIDDLFRFKNLQALYFYTDTRHIKCDDTEQLMRDIQNPEYATPTIYGYPYSYAESIARKFNLPFVSLPSSIPEEVPAVQETELHAGKTLYSKTITGLTPNVLYNCYAQPESGEMIFIQQVLADENGTMSVEFYAAPDEKMQYIVKGLEAPKIPYGDVDCDGKIKISDVVLLQRYTNEESVNITASGIVNADVNHDGDLSAEDVTMILKAIARLITL